MIIKVRALSAKYVTGENIEIPKEISGAVIVSESTKYVVALKQAQDFILSNLKERYDTKGRKLSTDIKIDYRVLEVVL